MSEVKKMSIPELANHLSENIREGSSESDVIQWLEDWATLRCKETARNVRHKACELYYDHEDPRDVDARIQQIRFQDVSPFN